MKPHILCRHIKDSALLKELHPSIAVSQGELGDPGAFDDSVVHDQRRHELDPSVSPARLAGEHLYFIRDFNRRTG
jgi:hypothetical protein